MTASPLLPQHQAQGARLTQEAGWQIPADFGGPASEHLACRKSAIVMDLSHRGKIRISGADAVKFLHSMLSNDVEGLKSGEGTYTTFLTRQGKLIADMNLYRREDDFFAGLAPGMAAVFAEAIDMYIIMDQVEVEDLTESQCALGLFGPESGNVLASAGFEIPALPEHGHIISDGVSIARALWTGEDGYLLTAPADRAESLWKSLAGAGATPAGLTAFETLSLEAGIPLFGKDMDGNINPMQAGLETRAIDFGKGCYVGQEVIAKIKHLGQVNRGLVGIRLEGETVPEPGSMAECGGEDAGVLTRSAFGPAVGAVIAFGFLHRKAMETGTAVTIRTSGSEIAGEVVDLPFYRSESLAIREKELAS